jgi:hypothetical protein
LNNEKSRDNYNTKVNKHLKEIAGIVELNNMVEVVRMSGKVVVTDKVPLSSVLSFHVARKSHATIVSQMGVDPFSVSSQMGHTSLNMTKRYVGQDEKGLKEVFDFINPKVDKNVDEVVIEKSQDDSLESKLDRLKTMRDEGRIPAEVYLEHVNKLLKEYGL